MAKKLIRITDKDNVAVALSPIVKGDVLNIDNLTITATMDITAGHKIALSDIKKGEAVIKYGYPIGYAKDDIPVGSAVHTFNVRTGLSEGAEYEYASYPSAELSYADGYKMENQNAYIKEDLKGGHTIRLGIETRITPSFSLRAGYNYYSAMFKETAYKALDYNDMRTDVEYTNNFGKHTATVGLGYAGKLFYADLAYKYDMYKSDFYAFSSESLPATKVTNDRHQLLLTLGVHF